MQRVSVDACIHVRVGECFRYYTEFDPRITREAFSSRYLTPVRDIGPQAGERLLRELLKVGQTEALFDATFAPMLIALGFCGQAFFEESRGEHEVALFVLMEANYWCGVMWASRGVREAEKRTVQDTARSTLTAMSTNAGQARYAELREYAKALAPSEIAPADPPLKASELAKKLIPKLHEYAATHNLTPLKGGPGDEHGRDSAQRTVEGWLRQLADEGLIELRRNRPK